MYKNIPWTRNPEIMAPVTEKFFYALEVTPPKSEPLLQDPARRSWMRRWCSSSHRAP